MKNSRDDDAVAVGDGYEKFQRYLAAPQVRVANGTARLPTPSGRWDNDQPRGKSAA